MAGAGVPTFDVTISIATYNRPELLERTLQSCVSQNNPMGLTYEILVTDNHPSGNAEPVVRRFEALGSVPVRYQQDLTRNMSVLRNVGIKAARGAYVAFIDDDEFADPDWLSALMGALRRTGADIAFGPRLAIFASGRPPAYDPKGRYFERVYDFAPDAIVALTAADGRPLYGLGTGNSISCVRTCMSEAHPFDPAFGDAGGEDIEYFMRQHIRGRAIAWAADARVTEIVPESRTKLAYRLIRARRETQIFVSTYMAHAKRPRMTWLSVMVKGAVQVVLGSIITVLNWEFGSEARIRGRLMTTVGLGKLSWRDPVGYIDEATFKPSDRP